MSFDWLRRFRSEERERTALPPAVSEREPDYGGGGDEGPGYQSKGLQRANEEREQRRYEKDLQDRANDFMKAQAAIDDPVEAEYAQADAEEQLRRQDEAQKGENLLENLDGLEGLLAEMEQRIRDSIPAGTDGEDGLDGEEGSIGSTGATGPAGADCEVTSSEISTETAAMISTALTAYLTSTAISTSYATSTATSTELVDAISDHNALLATSECHNGA